MRARLRMWAPTIAVAAALIALIAWSFHARWALLSASPFPLGVDGYFYPVQLRALLERGELWVPASPLAFYLLAPFAALTDPITGAKLGAALLGAAIAAPAYGVGARLGGGRGAGLVAAALATTSVGSTYLSVEFVKNGIGLTVALAALWLVLRATEQPGSRRIAGAIAGLVAAYATHKMAAALVVVVAIPAALGAATGRGALRGRRLLLAIGGLIALAVVALVLGAAFPQRFLSASDAALVGGLISATPRWTAPALVVPGGELALGHEALIGLVVAVVAAIAIVVRKRRGLPTQTPTAIAAASWAILALAIAIGLPFLDVTDRQGLAFRLRIAAFVPAALAAAIALRAALPRFAHAGAILAAVAAAIAIVRQPADRLDGEVVTHPALVAAVQGLNDHLPAGATLIVPERHIAFMVAWYTRAAVAIRPERVPPERRVRVLPLHFIGADSALDHALLAARAEPSVPPPIGVHPLHPNGLVIVPEPTWTWVLARLPPADRARFAAWPTI